jgi:hypothetical protein
LSASDLAAAINAEFGKSFRTGRKSKQPTSSADAISQLQDRCSNWLKWYEQLADEEVGELSVKDLPAPLRRRLEATMQEVQRLYDVAMRVR